MKYQFECIECGYGVEETLVDDEKEAEQEAVRHLLEDHGYTIRKFYDNGESA